MILYEEASRVLGIPYSDAEEEFGAADLSAVTASMVDQGIGHYEFWGAKSFDTRMELEKDGSGQVTLKWCQPDEGDHLEVPTSVTANRTLDDEVHSYEIHGTLIEVKATRSKVKVPHEGRFTYVPMWSVEAVYEYE